MGIGYWDWGLELGIGIGDLEWTSIGIGDWDWGLELDWGLGILGCVVAGLLKK